MIRVFLGLALLQFLITHCGKKEGVVGNDSQVGSITARFTDLNGSPAINAKVVLHPVDFNPFTEGLEKEKSFSDTVYTNNSGYFFMERIPWGHYVLEVTYGSALAFLNDSVILISNTVYVNYGKIKLKPVGSITGSVDLIAGGDTRNLTVALLGTDHMATPDSAGSFLFPSLADGLYKISIHAAPESYTDVATQGRANSGLVSDMGFIFLTEPIANFQRSLTSQVFFTAMRKFSPQGVLLDSAEAFFADRIGWLKDSMDAHKNIDTVVLYPSDYYMYLFDADSMGSLTGTTEQRWGTYSIASDSVCFTRLKEYKGVDTLFHTSNPPVDCYPWREKGLYLEGCVDQLSTYDTLADTLTNYSSRKYEKTCDSQYPIKGHGADTLVLIDFQSRLR